MVTNTSFSDYVASRNNGVSRDSGSILVMHDEPWDLINDWPSKASSFKEQRLVAVKVIAYGSDSCNKDGTMVTRDSECLDESPGFVSLPDFPRFSRNVRLTIKVGAGIAARLGF
jgi:hypothetical protein